MRDIFCDVLVVGGGETGIRAAVGNLQQKAGSDRCGGSSAAAERFGRIIRTGAL